MPSPAGLRRALRGPLALVLIAVGVLATVSPAAAAPSLPAGYVTLKRAGVAATGASMLGRDVTVTLRLRRRAAVRLAVVPARGDEQIAWIGPVQLRAGTTVLTRRMHGKPDPHRRHRLRVTADTGRAIGRAYVGVEVRPANRAPTGLDVRPAAVAEDQPAGALAGTLTTTDAGDDGSHAYALVAGNGDLDNGRFTVVGDELRTTEAFDFERRSSALVRLRTTDARGQFFDRVVAVRVEDADDAPGGLGLSPGGVAENAPAGTAAGTLSATDQDGDPLAFTLVAGPGDDDNAAFAADGATLRTTVPLDREARPVRTVRVRVSDGRGGAAEAGLAVTVSDVPEPPTLTAAGAALAYAEGDGAVPLAPGLELIDPDSFLLAGATVRITGGLDPTQDVLALAPRLGLFTAYDAYTGTLTLSGLAPVAEYRAALRAVTYANTSTRPSTVRRTVAFEVSDAEGAGASATRAVDVAAANDAPVVTASAGTAAYTENGAAVAVDAGLVVADTDDATLAGATVALAAGFEPGDELTFTAGGGISGSFDAATGVLALTGSASVAAYQAALRRVGFRAPDNDAPGASRSVRFTVSDGAAASAPATRGVAITATDDAPVVTTSAATLHYPEAAGPVAADPLVTVTDADSTLTGATVRVSAGFDAGQDELAFAGQLGITGSWDPATGILTLSGTASPPAYQAALRAITYRNGSAAPAPPARTLRFAVTDATGLTSAPATRPVALGAVNDAATVTTTPTPLALTEDDPATVLDGGLTVTDPDDVVLEGATVALTGGFQAGDEFALPAQPTVSGRFDAATGVLTLSGTASVAEYEAALQAVRFRSTSQDPAAIKTVALRADDGDGPGPAGTRTIAVAAAADAPVVTTSGGRASFTEDGAAVPVDPAVTVADADSPTLSGATVALGAGRDAARDVLAFPGRPGIAGAWDAATGTLTLSGTATPADYQAALRAVTFATAGDDPSATTRTVTVAVTDGGGTGSAPATRDAAVQPANDPPSPAADAVATDEDTVLQLAAPGLLANDTDPDGADTRTVVRLNGGALTGTSAQGAAVTLTAAGALAYTPGNRFQHLATGQTETDTFTYAVADGAGAEASATVTVTIAGVSDAPVAQADSAAVVGGTALYSGRSRPAGQAGRVVSGSVLDNDADPDSPHADLAVEPVTGAATVRGGRISLGADGTFTYVPAAGDTATDSFTYRVCDTAPCSASATATSTGTLTLPITGRVWYVANDAAAGGDGSSVAPFDTLAEAQAASAAGDTTYVFRGTGTTAGLDTGYRMDPTERLLGEAAPLTADPDGAGALGTETLFAGTAGARPALSATSGDVVALNTGVTVRALDLGPAAGAGGLAGGLAATGQAAGAATIADLRVHTAAAATQPAVELASTSATTTFEDLDVRSAGATGIRLANAGTVTFAGASTIDVASTGAPALSVTSTALGASAFDHVASTGSATGGAMLASVTGSVGFGDLDLVTAGGSAAALTLNAVDAVTVAAGSTVSASGGPAVDARTVGAGSLTFDTASSAGSATDALHLDGLGAAFSAAAGTLTGFAGNGVDVNGGAASVTYAGAIADGTGLSAEVSGRTGGTATLSGTIADGADTGGGVSLSANTGGSTVLSGASKVLSTGTADGVVMTSSGGHTLTLSGGGLDVDATSGRGLDASGGGTLTVSGTGNTVDTTTGRALRIASTTIGAAGATFQRISNAGAPNGIVLDATGASAGLTVTGAGGTCTAANHGGCSGGTIANAPGADDAGQTPVGTGIVLRSTMAPSLTRMWLHDHANYAIRGTGVAGFTLNDSVIDGTNGTNAAAGFDEAAVRFDGLTGAATIGSSTITGGHEDDLHVENASGSLDRLTVSGSTFGLTGAAGGNDAVSLQSGAGAGAFKATILNSVFAGTPDDLVDFDHQGSGAGELVLTGNAFANAHGAVAPGGGGVVLSSGGTAPTTFNVSSNSFRDAHGPAVLVVKAPGAATQTGTFATNAVGVAGVANSGSAEGAGLKLQNAGLGTMTWAVTGNQIRGYNTNGVELLAGGGASPAAGAVNATITANTIAQPGTTASLASVPKNGVQLNVGTQSGDAFQVCAAISGNDLSASGADAAPAIGQDFDVRLRQRFATTVRLPGFAGAPADTAAAAAFITGLNPAGAAVSAAASGLGGGFTGTGTSCP